MNPDNSSPVTTEQVQHAICEWMQKVVVDLNLCPFAKWPLQRQQVRVFVSQAQDVATLLVDFDKEVQRLDDTDSRELETTLVVVPYFLQSFDAYLDMLEVLDSSPWQGEYQIASFHPDYCFEGAEPPDRENLTNRAPYPIFHLLRESSVEQSIASYDQPESIPEANMRCMEALSDEDVARLFPYTLNSVDENANSPLNPEPELIQNGLKTTSSHVE